MTPQRVASGRVPGSGPAPSETSVRRRFSFILAGFLLLFGAHDAWAGAPVEELRTHIDQVMKILDDPVLKIDGRVEERRHAIRRVANDLFDFTETAKRALGRHWQGRTDEERKEFVRLFADLLEYSYIAKIERYGGPEKIRYGREQLDGDLATVATTISTKRGQEISVQYGMLQRGDQWLVYDVIVEGVSLISNYGGQFNRIVQTSSYGELVKQLRAKQKELIQEDVKG